MTCEFINLSSKVHDHLSKCGLVKQALVGQHDKKHKFLKIT
jgi:hypothetical protein